MSYHASEDPLITRAAEYYGVDPLFMIAIRQHENGESGREFGVLSIPAPRYIDQLTTCCASVRNHLTLYVGAVHRNVTRPGASRRLAYAREFIAHFGYKWCPVGADNDPKHLNENWIPRVTDFYEALVKDSAASGLQEA